MFGLKKSVLSAIVGIFLFKTFAQGSRSINSSQTMQNDEIISTVIDMNSSSSETSAILNQFNMSREDVERKISRINDSSAINHSSADDVSRR